MSTPKNHRYRFLFTVVALSIAITIAFFMMQPSTFDTQANNSGTPTHTATEAESTLPANTPNLPILASAQASVPNESTAPTEPHATSTMSPIARIRAIQEKTALHQSLLQDYAQHVRYPEFNRRFDSPSQDPTQRHYARDERVTVSGDEHFALTLSSDQKYYLPSQYAIIDAALLNPNGVAIPAKLAGQLIYNETKELGFVSFEDKRGDHRYQAHISLSDYQGQVLPPGIYKVLVAEQNSEVVDAVAFVISEPVIASTGQFRESLTDDGNLRIEAEVDVQAAHRYYVQASLYTISGSPVGTTQFSGELAPGRHWLPLEFHGLMLHDSEEAGPYTLKHLSLAKVGVPIERMPLLSTNYQTQSYALHELNQQKYGEALQE